MGGGEDERRPTVADYEAVIREVVDRTTRELVDERERERLAELFALPSEAERTRLREQPVIDAVTARAAEFEPAWRAVLALVDDVPPDAWRPREPEVVWRDPAPRTSDHTTPLRWPS